MQFLQLRTTWRECREAYSFADKHVLVERSKGNWILRCFGNERVSDTLRRGSGHHIAQATRLFYPEVPAGFRIFPIGWYDTICSNDIAGHYSRARMVATLNQRTRQAIPAFKTTLSRTMFTGSFLERRRNYCCYIRST